MSQSANGPAQRSLVTFVTGAAAGIGAACAVTLAGAGHRVVVADRDTAAAARIAAGLPGAIFVECDVSKPDSLDRAIALTLQHFGRLDAAVNNAGVGVPVPSMSVRRRSKSGGV